MNPSRLWRVLIVHNAYRIRGGEDAVVDAEADLLARRGHAVELYRRHNDDVEGLSRLSLAAQTVWSSRTSSELGDLIRKFGPDIVHVHNVFPLISASAHWTANGAGVPVVQTLHNFRLACLQAMWLREGRICEDCLGRLPWRGVVRACYRGSRAQSAVAAAANVVHRGLGTYRNKVDRYIALSEFGRRLFVRTGLPAQRIAVKPNFVDLPSPEERARSGGLFVGRIAPEKGVPVLLDAAARVAGARIDVIGEGQADGASAAPSGVHWLGRKSADEVYDAMRGARYLVMPSLWYEGFPRTLVEAYACGLPVIASRLGALAELVDEGRTGMLFEPGSADDLARCLRWMDAHPQEAAEMGRRARSTYEANYTPDRNYAALRDIYAVARGETVDGR